MPRSQLEMEDGCGGSGEERRDAQPGGNMEGTGQQKIINCCCHAFIGTLKPVFQTPHLFLLI